ncbi:hypothetical protein IPL85_04195 [Candidatus Saccharibacteria bacterium]|nr:MAG: hypothetical protein IPL85_04195 [Candidatus Saccharibacteria bacterium]
MASTIPVTTFLQSEEGKIFCRKLQAMLEDEAFTTTSSYNPNAEIYPDHSMSFVDKHVAYLCAHPGITAEQYLSNLRLKTRIR